MIPRWIMPCNFVSTGEHVFHLSEKPGYYYSQLAVCKVYATHLEYSNFLFFSLHNDHSIPEFLFDNIILSTLLSCTLLYVSDPAC